MNTLKFSTTIYSIILVPSLLFTVWKVQYLWQKNLPIYNSNIVTHASPDALSEYQVPTSLVPTSSKNITTTHASPDALSEYQVPTSLVPTSSKNITVTHAPSDAQSEYQEPVTNVKVEHEPMATCPDGEKLVGRLDVDQERANMEHLEKKYSLSYGGWVEKGGAWKPQHCLSKKVAIIIPYRNRSEHLKMFLRHIHPILKRQLLNYRIFLVEQEGNTSFNRAILFNIGFNESRNFNNYQCFIFHDIDLLPEDDRNLYSCPSSPRHMCPAVDKFAYRLPYKRLFGGVEAFTREHFEKVNGFSNKYWGWGGEDDDIRTRIEYKGLRLTRPSMKIGRYKMVQKHHPVQIKNEKRFHLWARAKSRIHSDGLNSLRYNISKTVNHLLYTHLFARVDPKTV